MPMTTVIKIMAGFQCERFEYAITAIYDSSNSSIIIIMILIVSKEIRPRNQTIVVEAS